MVAASFGLPALIQEHETFSLTKMATTSKSDQIKAKVIFSRLALRESARRSGLAVDDWQLYAIRSVMRHLSFAVTPPPALSVVLGTVALQTVQHLIPGDMLSVRLTQKNPLLVSLHQPPHFVFCIADWMRQAIAIRAGPQRFS